MFDPGHKINIWDKHEAGHIVCITTNYGWTRLSTNVMGAGVAKEAASRFPLLPGLYGEFCKNYYALTQEDTIPCQAYKNERLICFATKKLNIDAPYLSWKHNSNKRQIIHSAKSLVTLIRQNRWGKRKIYLPRPGCANGGLTWDFVKPLIQDILPDNVIICYQ